MGRDNMTLILLERSFLVDKVNRILLEVKILLRGILHRYNLLNLFQNQLDM
jgi:hypothetical protein